MKRIYFAVGSFIGLPIFLVLFWALKSSLTLAALVSLVYVVLNMVIAWRVGRITKLDLAVLGFFLVGTASALVYEPAGLFIMADYATAFLFLFLFCAAFFPVVLGFEPFTMAFAKRTTPSEVWETVQFKEINRIMALAWAGLFLAAAAIAVIPGPICKFVIPMLMSPVLGIPFNRKFPDWYLKRRGLAG